MEEKSYKFRIEGGVAAACNVTSHRQLTLLAINKLHFRRVFNPVAFQQLKL